VIWGSLVAMKSVVFEHVTPCSLQEHAASIARVWHLFRSHFRIP
jgi:hypothetical protein